MALVSAEGAILDVNPRIRELLWPNRAPQSGASLARVIDPEQRDAFKAFLSEMATADHPGQSREFACVTQCAKRRIIVFTLSPIRGLEGVARYFLVMTQDVTQSREMTQQLEYQARFDELTGLHNRRSFATRLQQVWSGQPQGKSSYLLAIDLDRFKVVNDTCGHAAGDELLVQVADILRPCVRDSDVVARNGGDEFAIILVGCGEDVARRKAELVRQQVSDIRFHYQGSVFRIGASIGVVRIDARVHSVEELTMLADSACYAAKEGGRNRVHFLTGAVQTAEEHRKEIRWVQRLPQALERDEFQLYCQRICPLGAHDAAEQFEVLLRLHDPAQGRIIPPGAFFPSVERFGLSRAIDEWVVNKTVQTIAERGLCADGGHRYWINLSGTSLNDPEFRRELRDTIARASLPPGALNFEITETVVMRSPREANKLIGSLRDMGCEFALDDFGSGVSSFGYLRSLDLDVVKIDGHFVRNLAQDQANRLFVKSIIDIAHALGLRTVAEFVEDDQTHRIVEQLGAEYGQGFGLHRPEPFSAHPVQLGSKSQTA